MPRGIFIHVVATKKRYYQIVGQTEVHFFHTSVYLLYEVFGHQFQWTQFFLHGFHFTQKPLHVACIQLHINWQVARDVSYVPNERLLVL